VYDWQTLVDMVKSRTGKGLTGGVLSRAPGRVEVLGNHTDYNGGMVLAATIERYVWTVGIRSGPTEICSREFGDCVSVEPGPIERMERLSWQSYVKGVHWAFDRAGYVTRGLSAAVGGDVPLGAGVSSSAALEVSYANFVDAMGGAVISKKDIASLAYDAEHLYCGIACGIMDQFTSQLCHEDSLLAIDCATLKTWDIYLSPQLRLVVVDSMVKRAAADVLNKRKNECNQALVTLQTAGWDVDSLCRLEPESLPAIGRVLDDNLMKRATHVINENARVKRGIILLNAGRTEEFGELMRESHQSSRYLYEVSHPKLDLLVKIANSQEGVLGARLTGAGLGGGVLTLVKDRHVRTFQEQVSRTYERETGVTPAIISGSIPGGAITSTI